MSCVFALRAVISRANWKNSIINASSFSLRRSCPRWAMFRLFRRAISSIRVGRAPGIMSGIFLVVLSAVLWMPFLDRGRLYPLEFVVWQDTEKVPAEVESSVDVPILVNSLVDEPRLELFCELEVELVPGRESLVPDHGYEVSEASSLGEGIVELITHLTVILSCLALADSLLHQSGDAGRRVDGGIDSLPVE